MAKIIITGGPCTGKSSTLRELAGAGYATIEEAARAVIESEQQREAYISGYRGVYPWRDIERFQKKVGEYQRNNERKLGVGIAFLDRSLVDCLAYGDRARMDIKPYREMARGAGYERAFLLDQLPEELYVNDSARKESRAGSEDVHERIGWWYKHLGIEVTRVPFMSPSERAKFIIKTLKGGE